MRISPYADQLKRLRKFDEYVSKKIDNKIDYARKVDKAHQPPQLDQINQ